MSSQAPPPPPPPQAGKASDVFARPPLPPPPLRAQLSNTSDDHPLSSTGGVSVEMSDPSRFRDSSQQHFPTPPVSSTTSSGLLPPPPPPPPSYTSPFPITAPTGPNNISIAPTPASATKSLEDLADMFLSGPSPRTDELGLQPKLNPDPLKADSSEMEKLKELVSRRAWADVLMLANQLRQGANSHYFPLYEALLSGKDSAGLALQTHQEDLIYVLKAVVHALVKLKHTKELRDELDRWSFCHHNDRTNAIDTNSWIPWSVHILAASAIQHTVTKEDSEWTQKHAYDNCLDSLWAIRTDLPSTEMNARLQVENALANVFLAHKEYRMVLDCYQRMMELVPELPNEQPSLSAAYKVDLLSRQGRVLLQAGALEQASVIFEKASAFWEATDTSIKSHDDVRIVPALLCVNDGLLKFSYGQFNEALEVFYKSIEELRKISRQQNQPVDPVAELSPVALTTRDDLYGETINNMALCALYTCRLHDALQWMESLVREDVTAYLTDRVALNLCTLYELASDSAASARKKRILQLVAKRFFLHDIGVESFRVS